MIEFLNNSSVWIDWMERSRGHHQGLRNLAW